MAPTPPRIGVLGTGYLGATHAAAMASLGYEVVAMDVDEAKVAALSAGTLPFFEPGLPELLREQLDSGRLRFTTSYEEVAAGADVHVLCVGTPQKAGEQSADVSYVEAVVEGLAPHLDRECLVVGKSTVPVGTAARMAERIAALAPAGPAVELAWNPEFLREGFAVEDTLRPDRLVIGVASERAEKALRDVYAPLLDQGVPIVVTDLATSELVKGAANAFLATKISFINAMAELCEHADGDVVALSEALGYDSRIGRRFLQAGLGFGGGCLPKDLRAFAARAAEVGADLSFLKEVDAINMRRRQRVVDLTRELLGGSVLGATVGVLGAAFKPDSDDIRDSPALNVAAQLQLQGAAVRVYDPQAMDNARRLFPTLVYADSVETASRHADVVLHLTEWREFAAIDPAELAALVAHRRLVDGRNTLDRAAWESAGWTYRGLGRP